MKTSVIGTYEELDHFLAAVNERFGDPSAMVCLMYVGWGNKQNAMPAIWSEWSDLDRVVLLHFVGMDGMDSVPLKVSLDEPGLTNEGGLAQFQIRPIAAGVWTISPSLNIPGQLHAFLVIHGVPEPAPWESRIILATSY